MQALNSNVYVLPHVSVSVSCAELLFLVNSRDI